MPSTTPKRPTPSPLPPPGLTDPSSTLPPTVAPHPIGDPEHEVGHEHRDVSGGWLRPTVFGMVDGLVSNFGLIAGVSAASTSAKSVVLVGVAGLVAGAISMSTGEFNSVQSQN